jgi:hypothetical protein
MVANADLGGPYATRAGVQAAAGASVVASVVLGMVSGKHYAIALPLAALVVMAGAIGPGAAIVGVLASFGLVIGIGIAGTPPISRCCAPQSWRAARSWRWRCRWRRGRLSQCARRGPRSPRRGARSQPCGKLRPPSMRTPRRRPSEHWCGRAQRSRLQSKAAMSSR